MTKAVSDKRSANGGQRSAYGGSRLQDMVDYPFPRSHVLGGEVQKQARAELAVLRRAAVLLRVIYREDVRELNVLHGEDGKTLMEHSGEVLELLDEVGE